MKMMLLCILLATLVCCSGFPTSDPRQTALISALDASLDQVNSQSLGQNLLRISRTKVMRVKPSLKVRDPKDVGAVFEVTLQFSVRETTCNKNTASDPTECEFQVETYMETPCESKVLVSHGRALVLKARCNLHTSSSSESSSSEEHPVNVICTHQFLLHFPLERFPSPWDPHGKKNLNLNPRWEEEEEKILDPYLLE
ncbi:secreted phosphoprotein 24 [Mixophyes fleayi]|uniref:secreted phosphoprotein 24 n=1 Tax=Mixophyes fleayi TaxID=3061075 RepID=UPI003F4DB914